MSSPKLVTSGLLFLICICPSFGQKLSQLNVYPKKVILVDRDSTQIFNISDKEYHSANIALTYYSFENGKVNSVQGELNGHPLEGSYKLYNKDVLMVSGEFKKGVKNGEWRYWNELGKLVEIESWSRGEKKGNHFTFDQNGELLNKTTYHKENKTAKEEAKVKSVKAERNKEGEFWSFLKIKKDQKEKTNKEKPESREERKWFQKKRESSKRKDTSKTTEKPRFFDRIKNVFFKDEKQS